MKEKYADKIDEEAEYGHQNQSVTLNGRRVEHSPDGLNEYRKANEHQEDGVDETRQDLEAAVTVSKTLIDFHLGNVRRIQSNCKGNAVEQHVTRVRYETK